MRRKITIATMIIICFLLEGTLFHRLSFGSITPNLMIVLTSSFGFMRGSKEGMFVGFFSGLLMDTFFCFGTLFGFYALLYMVIGYINGLFQRLFYDEDVKLPLVLIAASELVYGVVIYLFLFLMRSKFEFGYYLGHVIIPELVYTILVTVVLYRIILKINRRLEAEEKRSASKFV
ncbi:MAG: rod shape-determining protein MreD [Lachnospiraceae bacterium]